MILPKKYYCFLFSLFFILSLKAQNKEKTILLKDILSIISEQHSVTFNYIEEEIAVFKIIPPASDLSLKVKLEYISDKTQLKFEYISDKYISIFNNQNLDKPLCGFLYDNETKEPIENATILIKNTENYAISDASGYFELKIKSANDIEISHLNYKKTLVQSASLYVENCPKIYIERIINDLNSIVLQEYLTKGIEKKKDGTFEINPKKKGLLPGLTEPDVFQTLQQIPGINTSDEIISNISVRGGTHDQNLFLWNGIQLYQTGHFFGLISALNPNLAHKITFSKNGTSAFFGNSVSSTVLISTHTDSIEKTSGAIGLNLINGDFYTKIKTSNKSNIEISGRRSYTDFITSPTYRSYYNRIFQNTIVTNSLDNQNIPFNAKEDFYFYDFTLQYHQKIKKNTNLFIDILSISNVLDISQSKTENNSVTTRNSCLEQQTYGANASLHTKWNSKNSSEISFYTSYYNISSENEAIESNQIFNQENTVLDTGIKIENTLEINSNFTFYNGYQFNEIGVRNIDAVNSPIFYRNIKEVIRNHSLIAELKFNSKNDKITSKVGLRNTYIESFNTFIIEPRLQFNYSILPSLNLEILGERKHQTISQIIDLQQDFLGLEKRRWLLSNNDNIPIIKSNQASLGFSFSKRNWLMTLDNFYKKVEGITSSSQGFQNQFEFVKTSGNYTVYGSEFLIQKKYDPITVWMSYAFTENNYEFNTLIPSTFPNNFEIKHTLKSAVITDFNKLKLAIGTIWFSGKPFTSVMQSVPENTEIMYLDPNSLNLENYFQLNFSGSYSFSFGKNSKLDIGFSIQNLLNTQSTINQHYRINNNTNVVEKVNTYSLERTPNAFVRFYF